jgi:hypothetical protein
MANDTTKIGFSKPRVVGTIYTAPKGTALPTDATSELSDDYLNLGHLSADGFKEPASLSAGETIYADGKFPVDVAPSELNKSFTMTLLQAIDQQVNRAVFGDSNVVETAEGFAVIENNRPAPACVFVIDRLVGKGALLRLVIPNGVLFRTGDIAHSTEGLMSYEITLNALLDSLGNAVYRYYYTKNNETGIVVSVSAGENGAVVPIGDTVVQTGADLTITATPAEGYKVADWIVDGVNTGITASTYTLSRIQDTHTVQVQFEQST